MKINLSIIFCFFLVFSSAATVSRAQENVLIKIKTQMVDLAQENYELKQEYEEKVQELNDLKEKLKQEVEQFKVIEDRQERKEKAVKERKQELKNIYKKMDIVQSDILIKKSQVPFLKKQLLEKQEEYELLELRLADLKAQKKSLQSKLSDGSLSTAKVEKDLANKIVSLKLKLNTNIQKQENLSELIVAVEENSFSAAQKKQGIAHENQKLQNLIEDYRLKKGLKVKERDILNDKLALAKSSLEGDIKIRLIEKERLDEEVRMIEMQYNDLRQKIDQALKMKAKRKEYQQEMVAVDKANVQLRKKISDLRSQLDSLRGQ